MSDKTTGDKIYPIGSPEGIEEAKRRIAKAARSKAEELDLGGLGLTVIPDGLYSLSQLKILYLGYAKEIQEKPDYQRNDEDKKRCNALSALPPALFTSLAHLQHLSLQSNQLAALPDTISQITSLLNLSLQNNQLAALPLDLGLNQGLYGIDERGAAKFTVAENPFPMLPEGLSSDGDAVLDFLAGLRSGSRPSNEIKVVLIGEPKAGKTSLFDRLKYNIFKEHRDETIGLEIGSYEIVLPSGEGPQLCLNIWDFGGQDEYRSTQQFFFTPRALYLFLLDRRLNIDENKLRRWLSLVRKRAGPVKALMVATRCFEGGNAREHGLRAHELREIDRAYPNMILADILEIDSADPPYNIDRLKRRLYEEAWSVQQKYELRLPESWIEARNAILARKETHIGFEAFQAECEKAGMKSSAAWALATMLSNQGRLVYYGRDKRLSETVVLNAEWLMKAFAKVRQDKVDDADTLPDTKRPTRIRGGFLHRDRLGEIWTGDYADKHELLLRLMIRYGLSYQVTEDEWLIPELVPDQEPDCLPWHAGDLFKGDGEQIRRLVQLCHFGSDYDDQYDLSIIPGLIATITQRSNYYYVDRKRFWQEGVSLRHPTLDTEALITMAGRRVLRIETREPYPGGMMDEMRGLIEQVIHERWPAARQTQEPLYEFRAPCPSEGCGETIPVLTLLKAEKDEAAEFACLRYHKFHVSEVLRGIRPAELSLVSEIAELRADIRTMDRHLGDGLTLLEKRLGSDFARLLDLNADIKQCLNFLVGSATSKLPPGFTLSRPLRSILTIPSRFSAQRCDLAKFA